MRVFSILNMLLPQQQSATAHSRYDHDAVGQDPSPHW